MRDAAASLFAQGGHTKRNEHCSNNWDFRQRRRTVILRSLL